MVKYSELHRLLKNDGWYIVRQKGGHLIMRHPTKTGQLVIPYHGSKEVGSGLLKAILKKAKLQ
jgi:predicted RNA binding protein YcfA (HicA-like mRNA interferase family)